MKNQNNKSIQITAEWLATKKPFRAKDAHKGTFGTLSVRVGSFGMVGASAMCARAALRSGVGLVQFASDKIWVPSLMTLCPESIAQIFPEGCEQKIRFWRKILTEHGAVVVGPGLKPTEKNILRELLFLVESVPSLLLDAGAITIMSQYSDLFSEALKKRKESLVDPVVLTPHPGEFSRLAPKWDKSDRTKVPLKYATENGVVLVLKGHRTAVFSPDGQHFVNMTGNNGLAKAGSGDVLSGIIGGFLAQKISPLDAAVAGVYFHGLAGDIISERMGCRAMQPTDLFQALPDAYEQCGWK